MGLVCKKAQGKEIKNSILTLAEYARIAKEKNPEIINATIGMMYGDDGKLFKFESLEEIMSSLTHQQKFAYADTSGGPEYQEAIKRWVFRDYYDEFAKNVYTEVMATPGGSGAISNTFSNYINEGEKILLPSFMWSAYKNMARELKIVADTYELYDENHFNLKNVKEKILEHKKEQGRVLLVINDPCHNPSGLCMSYEEWTKLIEFVNEVTEDGTPFVLLHDMAYIDFYFKGFDASRQNIRLFQKLNPSAMAILAFSGSKTFSLYGLRIGAMLGISKEKQNIIDFRNVTEYSSRAKWSNVSKLGLSTITKCVLDKNYFHQFEEELIYARGLLDKRAKAFLKALDSNNIKYLPFVCGFFISIPVEEPVRIMNELIKKGAYVIPLENTIRIALCSIIESDAMPLALKIKQVIK